MTAKTALQYDTDIFVVQAGGPVDLQARSGFDDCRDLQSDPNALTFQGCFVGDSSVGTVATAMVSSGVIPPLTRPRSSSGVSAW